MSAPPPPCDHRWTRRADLDRGLRLIAFECDHCGAFGDRDFRRPESAPVLRGKGAFVDFVRRMVAEERSNERDDDLRKRGEIFGTKRRADVD